MTPKQQIATGFLATLIVCSVAFMPASADSTSAAGKSAPKHVSPIVATKADTSTNTNTNTAQAPNDAPRDLTYN